MQKINHYIDGTNFEGNSGKTSDVYNPATGEVSAKVCLANSNETKNAIDVAAKAFQALSENEINIGMISTSEIKLTLVIEEDDLEKAVKVLHDVFELDK